MTEVNDCIIFLLAKAYQKAHGVFKRRLLPYGLTPIQHLILEVLWAEEGQSASEIGRKLALDPATLSGVLDRLAEGEWIVKETDPEDKRVVRVFLGEKGKDWELGAHLTRAREQANEEILSGFSLEEKVLLKRLLRDFRE
ncbi:MAG: MarR family transcriptional regulator [Thermodesulfobacteriota bacterium]